MIEVLERLSPKETLDVLDTRLNLALGLRPVGPVGPRLKAVVPAEVPEDRVPLEARALEIPLQNDRLEIIVNDLMRNAAKCENAASWLQRKAASRSSRVATANILRL
jgi:hypothetical protein